MFTLAIGGSENEITFFARFVMVIGLSGVQFGL